MEKGGIGELQVGDWMKLPDGEWHENNAAKQIFKDAQDYAAENIVDGVKPQYQVETEPKDHRKAKLTRIR